MNLGGIEMRKFSCSLFCFQRGDWKVKFVSVKDGKEEGTGGKRMESSWACFSCFDIPWLWFFLVGFLLLKRFCVKPKCLKRLEMFLLYSFLCCFKDVKGVDCMELILALYGWRSLKFKIFHLWKVFPAAFREIFHYSRLQSFGRQFCYQLLRGIKNL